MKRLSEFFVKTEMGAGQRFVSFFKKYFIIFSVTIFFGLTFLFFWKTFHSKPYFTAVLINKDISKILDALSKIDRDCSILNIEKDRNYIDFLSVEKFSGSEVGCLNLAYSGKWKGPYLSSNPTLQGKLYEIVKTKEGIFIIPGVGVKLPSGHVIGKDFKIDKQTSILKMMKTDGELNFEGRPLAVQINFIIGDWNSDVQKRSEKIKYWQDIIDEFNAAMPFTKRKKPATAC